MTTTPTTAVAALIAIIALIPQPASAVSFDLFSGGSHATNIGTVTTIDLGSQPGSTDTVHIDISTNVRMGGTIGLSLLGNGRIDENSLGPSSLFVAMPHITPTDYNNYNAGGFSGFSDAIYGSDCS